MSRVASYGVIAERVQQSMYTVADIIVECPTCDEHMTVDVHGVDVEITIGCINGCEKERHFQRDALNDEALGVAAARRESMIHHYREGGV